MNLQSAKKQFSENANLFVQNPGQNIEKYNLYHGLVNLTAGIQTLQMEIEQIKNQISNCGKNCR